MYGRVDEKIELVKDLKRCS